MYNISDSLNFMDWFFTLLYIVTDVVVYDETLILQQQEPPTFHHGSPVFNESSTPLQTPKKTAEKNTYQVSSVAG